MKIPADLNPAPWRIRRSAPAFCRTWESHPAVSSHCTLWGWVGEARVGGGSQCLLIGRLGGFTVGMKVWNDYKQYWGACRSFFFFFLKSNVHFIFLFTHTFIHICINCRLIFPTVAEILNVNLTILKRSFVKRDTDRTSKDLTGQYITRTGHKRLCGSLRSFSLVETQVFSYFSYLLCFIGRDSTVTFPFITSSCNTFYP